MYRICSLTWLTVLAACQTYEPAPVDLAEHARAFDRRHEPQSQLGGFDLTDGITRLEGRGLALMFHPDCRLARLRAGVARATAEHAGQFDDPVLALDFERILESVPHQWLVSSAIQLTLPLFGRLDREQQLAERREWAALLEAWLAEQEVLLEVDRAWVTWSAAQLRVEAVADMLQRIIGLELIAQRLSEAGALTRPEARVFSLERLSRTNELEAAKANATTTQLTLLRLTGLHPAAQVTFLPTTDLGLPSRPEKTVREFIRSPSANRLGLEHGIRENQLALEIARQWPDLMLGPGWQEEDAQPRLALGVSLPLPLWNRNAQNIATAQAHRTLAAEALRCGLEQFFHDVTLAERQYDVAVERRQRIERELVPLANQQLADSRTLAERGTLDVLLLLDSLARAHSARIHAIDATQQQSMRATDLTSLCWIAPSYPWGVSQ